MKIVIIFGLSVSILVLLLIAGRRAKNKSRRKLVIMVDQGLPDGSQLPVGEFETVTLELHDSPGNIVPIPTDAQLTVSLKDDEGNAGQLVTDTAGAITEKLVNGDFGSSGEIDAECVLDDGTDLKSTWKFEVVAGKPETLSIMVSPPQPNPPASA